MTEATVERIRLFLIESPIRMARLQGVGNVKGTVKRVLIELTSSDGVVGWGEAAPWEVFTGTPEAAFSALDIYLRPIVLGKPVRRIRALMAELDRALVGHAEAKVGIEMALLDIVGKSSGLSVADLLGGRVRDTIPLSFSIADPDFAADLERMRKMVPEGNVIYKVKTGVKPHREDLDHLEAIRKEFGDQVDLRPPLVRVHKGEAGAEANPGNRNPRPRRLSLQAAQHVGIGCQVIFGFLAGPGK